jgi:cytochrome c oxidase subunit 1
MPSAMTSSPNEDAVVVRRWLGVAIGSLMLAGALSILIVIARTPPFDRLVTDPGFFKRCLVVHVDLALVVWFYAFLAALFYLIPRRRAPGVLAAHAPRVAIVGVALLLVGAGVPGALPVLANYVPAIDTAPFHTGLLVFATALLCAFAEGRLLPDGEAADAEGVFAIPPAARAGLRTAGALVLIALTTFAASLSSTPSGLPSTSRLEAIAWGGGHVLQFASIAGMLSAWLILLARVLGESPISRRVAAWLFTLLAAPTLLGPPLAGLGARVPFTRLMQLGIFPVVTIVLVLCGRALWRARRPGLFREPEVLAFLASAALTLTGFVVGASIHGSNTTVPGHYHASIGAVTVAYMGLAYPLLHAVGLPLARLRHRTWARWQPLVFGAGQTVFALGFTLAGAHGMARKSYGAEQAARTTVETLGLIVMGAGGLVAVVGGLTFLWICGSAYRNRSHHAQGATSWQTSASIRSNG